MTNEIDQRIGSHARSLRVAAGLTPGEVARALGISAAAYEAREAGTVRFSAFHLYDLAQLFDCGLRSFFAGTSHPATRKTASG
jgi:transcriptional regulator with XRE-family HTH domain